ncbi:MAG TPA: FAD binding domain-containing protein [Candidatus Dormibacteraeota bacterium]|nr:FAD binding domain-containing protein [Candidatus Dormibacteraeota bacterium]
MTVSSYARPTSLSEALALLEAGGPSLLVIAGGTVAMPLINEGLSLPEQVLGLRSIAGLDRLEDADGGLHIGATVTLTRLLETSPIAMLREAAAATASWAVRDLATVGGNLFTPPPGGDVAVALLALDTMVVVAGPQGERRLPIEQLWTGFMTTALEDTELVTEVRVPPVRGETAYLKFGRKQANTPAVVTVAARVVLEAGRVSEARIALGAVGPHPIRAHAAEAAIVGSSLEEAAIARASMTAAAECSPVTDAIATEWYRRRMVALFVGRALRPLAGVAEGGR